MSTRRLFAFIMLLLLLGSLSPGLHAALPSEEAILRQGGEDAKKIIEKAYSIIRHARVFTSKGAGEGGTPTEGAWALTVITRYDPKAVEELKPLAEQSKNLEVKLYAIAGLITLEPKDAAKYRLETFPESVLKAEAHSLCGCIYEKQFYMIIYWLVDQGGWQRCTFEKLPPFFETHDVPRSGEGE
ncbi:hypothetical protein [Roseimicrobium sp. ORNL1]|uniref:hypothetical protein n=1 Tax=Roseimicrobium sp. ORNL1 TaxID=2711231 RepID=UPI0013E14AF6|nr:hypothetical protein [Roseimicrobium sp. ORNL1]QIF01304.1 hypothetical protein G5S37_07140 [Roseimicrobium sp. ORNL1]